MEGRGANSRFLPKFEIFAEISDFRRNFEFSPNFQIFTEISDFRSKRSKMFSRSRRAARPLPPPPRRRPRRRCGGGRGRRRGRGQNLISESIQFRILSEKLVQAHCSARHQAIPRSSRLHCQARHLRGNEHSSAPPTVRPQT